MTFSLPNINFARDYVHYATLTGHTDNVNSVAFNPNGDTLASGGSDKTIRLWDVTTGAHKTTLTGHTGYVMCVAFSPDGQVMVLLVTFARRSLDTLKRFGAYLLARMDVYS